MRLKDTKNKSKLNNKNKNNESTGTVVLPQQTDNKNVQK